MTRTVTAAVNTALTGYNIPCFFAVELQFDAGTTRVCNAGYNYTINGNIFYAIGTMGKISTIQESADLAAYGITMELSGIDSAEIAIALAEPYQGRPCKVWMVFLSEQLQVIADPVLIFNGRIDLMDIQLGDTATITLTAESRLIDLERPRVRRYNHEDQIIDYPGDNGFEYVPLMVNIELLWGKENA